MKTLYKIASYIVIVMGIIHISRTSIIFAEMKILTGLYIATGLMSVFVGFLNILYWRANNDDKLVKWLCLSANFISFIFFLLALIFGILYNHFIPVLIAVILHALLAFSSFYFGIIKNK